MNFNLTKDQEIFRKKVRKFAETEIAPAILELWEPLLRKKLDDKDV